MYKSLLKPRIEVQRGALRGKFEQGRSCILDIDIHDGHEFYVTYIGRTVLVKLYCRRVVTRILEEWTLHSSKSIMPP